MVTVLLHVFLPLGFLNFLAQTHSNLPKIKQARKARLAGHNSLTRSGKLESKLVSSAKRVDIGYWILRSLGLENFMFNANMTLRNLYTRNIMLPL